MNSVGSRPAPEMPDLPSIGDRRVEQPGLGERRERERRGRRVAAGIGDLPRVEHVLPEQLREAVGPVGIEPEVGAEIDDGRAGARDRLAELAARTVRQAEEGDVAARERLRRERVEALGARLCGLQRELRVPGEQPRELATRVARGARDARAQRARSRPRWPEGCVVGVAMVA